MYLIIDAFIAFLVSVVLIILVKRKSHQTLCEEHMRCISKKEISWSSEVANSWNNGLALKISIKSIYCPISILSKYRKKRNFFLSHGNKLLFLYFDWVVYCILCECVIDWSNKKRPESLCQSIHKGYLYTRGLHVFSRWTVLEYWSQLSDIKSFIIQDFPLNLIYWEVLLFLSIIILLLITITVLFYFPGNL